MAGKPLIGWTIEAAIESKMFDDVVVSTDCEEIQSVAIAHGANASFLRPSSLATDSASSAHVVIDTLERFPGHDWFCLLQPTSPLRNSRDILASWEVAKTRDAKSVTSVVESEHPIEWTLRINVQGELENEYPTAAATKARQKLPKGFLPNGSIFWVATDSFRAENTFRPHPNHPYVMERERSVDIDTKLDFELAEWIFDKLACEK